MIDFVLRVRAGSGIVGRGERHVVLVAGDVAASPASDLLELVRSDPQADGRQLALRLAHFLTTVESPSLVPAFGVLALADDGVMAFLYGSVVLSAEGASQSIALAGDDRPTWVDEFLPSGLTTVDVTVRDQAGPAWGAPADLVRGTVPGAGFVMQLRSGSVAPPADVADTEADMDTSEAAVVAAPPAAVGALAGDAADGAGEVEAVAADVAPLPESGEGEASWEPHAFEAIDLSAPPSDEIRPLDIESDQIVEETAVEGLLVDGKLCPQAHFNHPLARYCSHCGRAFDQTLRIVQGARPPVGQLVFSDGSILKLDGDYIIGRDPTGDELVVSGVATAWRLEDEERMLSRSHAHVHLDGWDVQVFDRHSSNGTWVRTSDDADWERVGSDVPAKLDRGVTVRLGPHEFTFFSHHLREI